ncbi:MAG: photosynthetic complex assembly protein PuhC [Pseudomonadota bacterium]
MTQHTDHEIRGIHRLPLWGAFGVALLSLLLVTVFVVSGAKPVRVADSPVVAERSLIFRDGTNGAVVVRDAHSYRELVSFNKGEGAFVRISMRGMTRQRILKQLDVASPYNLVKTERGNLFIVDPLSLNKIRVDAFGPIAIKSFNQFLARDYSEKGAKG